jgi:hypothetical protein
MLTIAIEDAQEERLTIAVENAKKLTIAIKEEAKRKRLRSNTKRRHAVA